MLAFPAAAGAIHNNPRGIAGRIEGRDRRCKHPSHASLGEQPAVGLKRSRVAVKVFARTELCWVDEDRDHHVVAVGCCFDEADMARMQSAHGWHKADPPAGRSRRKHRAADRCRVVFDHQGVCLGHLSHCLHGSECLVGGFTKVIGVDAEDSLGNRQ